MVKSGIYRQLPIVLILSLSVSISCCTEDGGRGAGEEDDRNRTPVADAGYDLTAAPGESVQLSGNGSYDPDGDELDFRWDLDDSVDSDMDGKDDNDVDARGITVNHVFPIPSETTTYTVVLNVTDGSRWDKDRVKVTVMMQDNMTPPEIDMSCRYVESPSGIIGVDPHFMITVDDVTRTENLMNYSFEVLGENEEVLSEDELRVLTLNTYEDDIRYRDITDLGKLSSGDQILIRETEDYTTGVRFLLYYLMGKDPAGEVILTK